MGGKKWALRVVSGKVKKKPSRVKKKRKAPSVLKIIEDLAFREMQPYEGYFRPSMLYGCDRQNVFHYTNVRPGPQNIQPRLRRILDNGHAVHDFTQNNYFNKTYEYWFAKEALVRKVVNGYVIKGSCDGVFIRRSDLFRFGLELKTISADEFSRLTKPKPDHVFQAGIYMELQDLPLIVIVYWNKNNQNIKEYPVWRDDHSGIWEETEERVEYLGSFIEKKKLPKFDRATCNKQFCRYVKHCRKKGAPV